MVLNLAKATLPPNFADQHDDDDGSPNEPSGSISIYTTHCSPSHCYDEVRPPNGPLSPFVNVRGSWIPRKLSLGGTALCSALRILYLTYCAMSENPDASVFVLDVLPTGVPYLVEYNNVMAGVLFYCHFPDKLLTRDTVNGESGSDGRTNASMSTFSLVGLLFNILMILKELYRWVLDTTEEWTMSFSDLIVVNSKFTMGQVEQTFPSLFLPRNDSNSQTAIEQHGERVKVLYPAIESSISKEKKRNNRAKGKTDSTMKESKARGPIVSLNRFERKKNVPLLLQAYDLLLEQSIKRKSDMHLPPLIIAGGYDPLNVENVEHLAELRVVADEILARYNLPKSTVVSPSTPGAAQPEAASITFYPSISNDQRTQLLSSASVWCYTPHREHFGIVPLEAMDAGVPVVAIRSGGPMETIVDGVTGRLVEYAGMEIDTTNGTAAVNPTVKGFADAIASILADPNKSKTMGRRGRERVDQVFGMDTFRKQWWELLNEAQKRGSERHFSRTFSYPRLGFSLLRCIWEIMLVVLIVVMITWSLERVGLLQEGAGIVGTVKVQYRKWRSVGEEL